MIATFSARGIRLPVNLAPVELTFSFTKGCQEMVALGVGLRLFDVFGGHGALLDADRAGSLLLD